MQERRFAASLIFAEDAAAATSTGAALRSLRLAAGTSRTAPTPLGAFAGLAAIKSLDDKPVIAALLDADLPPFHRLFGPGPFALTAQRASP